MTLIELQCNSMITLFGRQAQCLQKQEGSPKCIAHYASVLRTGVPNLSSEGATSTQCNIFWGRSKQFILKWCTAAMGKVRPFCHRGQYFAALLRPSVWKPLPSWLQHPSRLLKRSSCIHVKFCEITCEQGQIFSWHIPCPFSTVNESRDFSLRAAGKIYLNQFILRPKYSNLPFQSLISCW